MTCKHLPVRLFTWCSHLGSNLDQRHLHIFGHRDLSAFGFMAADRDWSNDRRWQDSRRYGTSYNSSSSASSSAAASSAAPVRRATKAEGCVHPYGPPKVEPEDCWTPPNGGPRQVRCHQCNYWEQWQYVVEKGAIEGNPVLGDLECWRCYIQRTDSTQKWGDVKPLFQNLTVKKRNDRVERYQNCSRM